MRRPPAPREKDFTSTLRGPEVATRVGTWLGICFTVAFLTGVWSHLYQDQPSWLTIPTRPVWVYRVTQGLHYLSGTAAVPLLLVKLYAVYPKLFAQVPWRRMRELSVHLLERGSIALLVAAGIFQLVTGVANSAQFYPWSFSFRSAHYAVAWVAFGALVLHVAVRLAVIRSAYSRPISDGEQPGRALTRRGLVRTAVGASAVAVVSVAGGTVPWLRTVSIFETHDGSGPQDLPINKSARRAGVVRPALDPAYRLEVVHGGLTRRLALADLRRMPQHTERLPIACVEGWSASGLWTGVRLRDLLALVGAPPGSTVHVESLQPQGAFRASEVRANLAADPLTLVTEPQRLRAQHRPWISLPACGAQPAGRAADQVGRPDRGGLMPRPGLSATRLALGATGIVLILVGLVHLLGSGFTSLVSIVVFLAGGVPPPPPPPRPPPPGGARLTPKKTPQPQPHGARPRRRRRPHGARGSGLLPSGRRARGRGGGGRRERARVDARAAVRPRRARPDAARHRRPRGVPTPA